MKAEEIGRMLDVVKQIGDAEYETAQSMKAGGAFAAGVAHLRDTLLGMLDVREFITLEEPDDKDTLAAAMVLFCERWCGYSREAAPGEHKVCEPCPLAPTTIGRLRNQVAAAMEANNDTQG